MEIYEELELEKHIVLFETRGKTREVS